jgi:hypothetical protein
VQLPFAHDVLPDRVAHIQQDAQLEGQIDHARKLLIPLNSKLIVEKADLASDQIAHQSPAFLHRSAELEPHLGNRAANGVFGRSDVGSKNIRLVTGLPNRSSNLNYPVTSGDVTLACDART